MGRGLTQKVKDEFASDHIIPFYLFEFEYDNETSRFWTGSGDLQWNGNTYVGAGNAITVSSINETQEIKAENVEFTLTGVPEDLMSLSLTEPYQGRPATVRFGLFDENSSIVDVFVIWKGEMDKKDHDENSGELTIIINCESRLVDLKRARNRRWTHEDQQSEYPNDKGFEYVTSIQEKEIEWGR